MREIVININDANQRLDKFLTKFMPKLPAGMLYKGLRKNYVRINGRHIKDGSFMLSCGDRLTLYFKDEFFGSGKAFEPKSFDCLDIIYEDKNIMLLNKPAGLVVHTDENKASETLIDSVKSYLYEKGEYDPNSEHSFSPALCNRLDRNTGGIIIAAKNAEALREMNEKIRSRKVIKRYLCVVEGIIEKSGTIEGYLKRGNKKVTVKSAPSPDSKFIKTNYTPLASDGRETLVEAELITGRTHQIRAGFAYISHPLKGDRKYGSSSGGQYKLYSYKLIFLPDKTDGILNYLSEREFTVNVDFAKKFFSQNM